MTHASAEDVELWLDEGLVLDVRLRDEDWHMLQQSLRVEHEARALAQLRSHPHLAPPVPMPARQWHEAEVVEVRGRYIRVRFMEERLRQLWINVDEDHARLAELHTMTAREREGLIDRDNAIDLCVDADELFDEVVARAGDVRAVNTTKACRAFVDQFMTASSALGSDDIQSESVVLPLYDPLTHCRLHVPVRGSHCHHAQCFDLKTHIEHQKRDIIWKCPICKEEAFANDLTIDPFMLAVVQSLSPATVNGTAILRSMSEEFENRQVIVESDGGWRVEDREKRKRRRDHPTSTSQSPSNGKHDISDGDSTRESRYRPLPFSVPFSEYRQNDSDWIDLSESHHTDAALLQWFVDRVQVKLEQQQNEQARALRTRSASGHAQPTQPASASSSSVSPQASLSPCSSALAAPPRAASSIFPAPPSSSPAPNGNASPRINSDGLAHVVQRIHAQQLQHPSTVAAFNPLLNQILSYPLPPPTMTLAPALAQQRVAKKSRQEPNGHGRSSFGRHAQSPALPSTSALASHAPAPVPMFPFPSAGSPSVATIAPASTSAAASPPHAPAAVALTSSSLAYTNPYYPQLALPPTLPPIRQADAASALPVAAPSPLQPAVAGSASSSQSSSDAVLNLNTCDVAELMRAGLSRRYAQLVLDARAERGQFGFQSVQEVLQISGIGKKTLQKLLQRHCQI